MAEYQEVMRHMKRMCNFYPECGYHCPLYRNDAGLCGCSAGVNTEAGMQTQSDVVERKVMKWAAEHPEYPTWQDLLVRVGVMEKSRQDSNAHFRFTIKVHDRITEKDAKSIGLDLSEAWRDGEWVQN